MHKLISICLIMITILSGCEDVIVKDISGEVIELRAPVDGLSSVSKTCTFWWYTVDGASEYELLIASPDMKNTITLIMDTVVNKDNFVMELPAAGQYEWCVRGLNSGYTTEFACRKIEIQED